MDLPLGGAPLALTGELVNPSRIHSIADHLLSIAKQRLFNGFVGDLQGGGASMASDCGAVASSGLDDRADMARHLSETEIFKTIA